MDFEGNAARELPSTGDEAPKLKKDIQGTEEYYAHLSQWDPKKLTPEDMKNWESLKKANETFTDVQRARLAELRKMQFNFGVGEGFTEDERIEFLYLSELEEKDKKRLNQQL